MAILGGPRPESWPTSVVSCRPRALSQSKPPSLPNDSRRIFGQGATPKRRRCSGPTASRSRAHNLAQKTRAHCPNRNHQASPTIRGGFLARVRPRSGDAVVGLPQAALGPKPPKDPRALSQSKPPSLPNDSRRIFGQGASPKRRRCSGPTASRSRAHNLAQKTRAHCPNRNHQASPTIRGGFLARLRPRSGDAVVGLPQAALGPQPGQKDPRAQTHPNHGTQARNTYHGASGD